MPRRKVLQTNFSAGELAPDLSVRQDTEQYQNGARSLRNRRCLIGGGTKRRPGTRWLVDLPGPARMASWVVNEDTKYVCAIGAERIDFFLLDGTPSGSITSAPWTEAIWRDLNWVQTANTMFLVHPDMVPQIITRTGPASWVRSAFDYYDGPAGRPEQPYLKLVDPAVTLRPSALTGSVTMTASAAIFSPLHINSYIRYLEKAALVTAVAGDGLSATATVVEALPDTQTLTVTSSASFATGELVEGNTSGAKGLITGVPNSTTLTVVLVQGLTPFQSEQLIGPQAKTNISGVASAGTKAAVTDWDEQMFGPVYGYPGCVELHRNRLIFAGHKTAPDYLVASALNNLYDFNVGDGSDGDAIVESIGDAGASRIVQLHSAEQLLVLTDNGPYYCPEGATAPFRPSSIAFFPFGSPWSITPSARPQPFDNGVLFLSGSLAIKARPTGDVNRAWEADEVSLLAHHLLSNPTELAVTSNFGNGPERYALMQNDNGTLAVMQLVEAQRIRNLTPWDTDGTILSITAIDSDVFQAATRVIGGNYLHVIETYDQDITLDAATEYDDLDDVADRYGGTAVNVVTGRYHLGTMPLSISNVPAGPYTVGLYYDSVVETLPPIIEDEEGPASSDLMRIVQADAYVIGSQRFAANGYALQAYQVTDAVDQPPPVKEGWQKFGFLGWRRDPTIVFNQPDPLPLDLIGIRAIVAYG